MTQKLTVTLSRTRDGLGDYMQIMSDDFMAVNIVLIAGEIEVVDARTGVVAQKSKSVQRREAIMKTHRPVRRA